MPSLDLFLFLEPTSRNTAIPRRKLQPTIVSDFSIAPFVYDLSLTVGHGQCTDAMFSALEMDLDPIFDDPEALADCHNILGAINENRMEAVSVMKYSKQPTVKFRDNLEIIRDFGPTLVTKSLTNSASFKKRSALAEAEDPRVLGCADSEGGIICSSLQRVVSSAGYSLAFNSLQSVDSFTNQSLHAEFINMILHDKENMYAAMFYQMAI